MAYTPSGESKADPSVLVLTLHSGEAEYGRCCESLQAQSHRNREHRVFEDLPNREAHVRLYRTIMDESENFDLFLKLDADMVLADERVLADLVGVFEGRTDLDHLVVAVSDWMTDSFIIGAHLFSNRVSWEEHFESLYVDPDPVFPGRKIVVDRPTRDLILHAGDPTPVQAFHFGAHRALQASQAYRPLAAFRPHNARVQWQYLDRVWRHYERTGDRRLGLAILAADQVFARRLPATANEYADPALISAFETASELDEPAVRARLVQRWGSASARQRTWLRALGPAKAGVVTIRGLRDVAASLFKAVTGGRAPAVEIGNKV